MCQIRGCDGAATVAITVAGGVKVQLCATHAGFLRTKCKACGKFVRIGEIDVADNQPYGAPSNLVLCTACDGLRKVACPVCRRILEVDGQVFANIQPYAGGKVNLCADPCDAQVVDRCVVCTTPTTTRPAANLGPVMVRGASEVKAPSQQVVGLRCEVCSVNPITSTAAAQPYYNAAVAWMTGWVGASGGSYPAYDGRLTWQVALDGTFGQHSAPGHPLGRCRLVDGQPPTYQISILSHMRPISFQASLLHELTHAWAFENSVGNKPLIEGFCNYVAYLYLQHLKDTATDADRAEAGACIERMEQERVKEYGPDFLRIRQTLAAAPKTAISWFKHTA